MISGFVKNCFSMTAAKREIQKDLQQGSLQPRTALEIWLESYPVLAATKIVFTFSPLRLHRVLVRGRSSGAFPSPYSFPWSAGPRALSLLALISKAHGQRELLSTD